MSTHCQKKYRKLRTEGYGYQTHNDRYSGKDIISNGMLKILCESLLEIVRLFDKFLLARIPDRQHEMLLYKIGHGDIMDNNGSVTFAVP